MATIDKENRHILDRKKGGRKISYSVPVCNKVEIDPNFFSETIDSKEALTWPKKSGDLIKTEMKPYLEAHEKIIVHFDRETVNINKLKQYVIAYAEAPDKETKRRIINKAAMESNAVMFGQITQGSPVAQVKTPKEIPIEKLLELRCSEKTVNHKERTNFTDIERERWKKSIGAFQRGRNTMAAFFDDIGIEYVSGLVCGLDYEYIDWRDSRKFDNKKRETQTSDETINKELDILKRIAVIAEKNL
jgi:hypothetical protein